MADKPGFPPDESQQPDSGVRRIAAERERQVTVEGYSPEHDDAHDKCDLAWAAVAYAVAGLKPWWRRL